MKTWDAFRGRLDERDNFFSVHTIGKFFTTVVHPKAQTHICEEATSPKQENSETIKERPEWPVWGSSPNAGHVKWAEQGTGSRKGQEGCYLSGLREVH